MRAYVRVVKIERRFRDVTPDRVYCEIPGLDEPANSVWMGRWEPQTPWEAMPPVLQIETDQDFQQNGVQSATIEIDNVAMVEQTGVGGIFHAIERGYYAPFRGYSGGPRPPIAEQNDWFDKLNDKSANIIVVAGYGDVAIPIFEGLVNDVDMTSHPDKMTLTCRDGGQLFTDQHVFLNAKVRKVRDPITFCDRRQAEKTEEVAQGAQASSDSGGNIPRFSIDEETETFWQSGGNDSAGAFEWLQFGLPNGLYDSIEILPRVEEMECYIAIKAKDSHAPGGEGAVVFDTGERLHDGDWIDMGLGNVPGTDIPYVHHVNQLKAKKRELQFDRFKLGDDSQVRVFFTNLPRGPVAHHTLGHRAQVTEIHALRRRLPSEVRKAKWIIVDDLADVVRCVFQWCGINEWEVETTGVRLKDKVVFNRGNFLIDIIKNASEQVGYAFHMKPRESFDESPAALASTASEDSMGIAVWRQAQAMYDTPFDPIELFHEDGILQGAAVKLSDDPLAYNIRVRGKEDKDGLTNAGERIKRFHYNYRPPWTRDDDARNANIKKYAVHHDPKLKSVDDCKVAALFIAFREALESAQLQFEGPAMPTIFLDHQTAVMDTGTGISARIWVALRQLTYRSGEDGHFRINLGGSILDTPDVTAVKAELVQALRDNNYNPGLSDWELDHHGDFYHDN